MRQDGLYGRDRLLGIDWVVRRGVKGVEGAGEKI